MQRRPAARPQRAPARGRRPASRHGRGGQRHVAEARSRPWHRPRPRESVDANAAEWRCARHSRRAAGHCSTDWPQRLGAATCIHGHVPCPGPAPVLQAHTARELRACLGQPAREAAPKNCLERRPRRGRAEAAATRAALSEVHQAASVFRAGGGAELDEQRACHHRRLGLHELPALLQRHRRPRRLQPEVGGSGRLGCQRLALWQHGGHCHLAGRICGRGAGSIFLGLEPASRAAVFCGSLRRET
mmetsp:Transcript_7423/g.18760  ORF Transcript_7423/g.18760 Transcript_7423/m.18760 type:complete len:245 (+) Transcript_7423:729-1463(+)